MAVSSPDLKASLAATPFFGGVSDASLGLLVSNATARFCCRVGDRPRAISSLAYTAVHSPRLRWVKIGRGGMSAATAAFSESGRAGRGRFTGRRAAQPQRASLSLRHTNRLWHSSARQHLVPAARQGFELRESSNAELQAREPARVRNAMSPIAMHAATND
jgi:hypothetical protein